MPLPTGGAWPPNPNRRALDTINTWSAWYSGDPDQLSRVYERIGNRIVNRPNVRPSQYRGGLVGTLARWFWGQPIATGEKRTKLHMPIASDIATTSADLLFSERITATSEDTATQDKLTELLGDHMHAQLLESAEVAAGLGGVYLRAVWDQDVRPDGPWMSSVHADAAIPEWSYGILRAVTFWRELAHNGREVARHLERHEPGRILHGLYLGDEDNLGRKVPLKELPDTAMLADVVTEGDTILTGITQLTASYVPNMKPNRLWRSDPASCHLGRSDYSSTEPFMDSLDEIYTDWMRDIRLAKGRVFVPDTMLQDRGPGKGAYFDPDREIYQGLTALSDPKSSMGQQITLHQFEIRVDEHERSAMHWISRIISSCGYDDQSFGMQGDGAAITATEVDARRRKGLITRDKKINYWRPELQDHLEVLLALGSTHFGWNVQVDKPIVVFPDAVQPDQAQLAQTLALFESARAMSIETKVRLANPDKKDDETWIKEEVQRIKDEQGVGPVANPDGFHPGGNTNQPPQEQPPQGGA